MRYLLTLLLLPLAVSGAVMTGPNSSGGAYTFNTSLYTTYTNYGGLATGLLFVDAVTGSDATGTGSPDNPYATLSKAQTMATNGMTVYAARGTFAESGLGKEGVSWYFNDGVFLLGSAGLPPFFLGATNATTSLYISGRLTHTNDLLLLGAATNCVAYIDLKEGQNGISGGYVVELAAHNGLNISNQIFYTCDKAGGGIVYRTTGALSNFWNQFYFTGRRSLQMKSTAAAGSGGSNLFFYFTAPNFTAQNNTATFFSTSNNVIVTSPNFKTTAAMGAVGAFYWFNVTANTTNDFNTNTGRGYYNILR